MRLKTGSFLNCIIVMNENMKYYAGQTDDQRNV